MGDAVTAALVGCFGHDVGMAIDAWRAPTWNFTCGGVSRSGRAPGTVHHSSHFVLRQHVFYRVPGEVEVDFFFKTGGLGPRLDSVSVTVGERAWHSMSEPFRLTVEGRTTFECSPAMSVLCTIPELMWRLQGHADRPASAGGVCASGSVGGFLRPASVVFCCLKLPARGTHRVAPSAARPLFFPVFRRVRARHRAHPPAARASLAPPMPAPPLPRGMLGFVAYHVPHGRRRFVDQIYVAPGARRAGVGRALLRALADGPIELIVRADNAAAIAFYARAGFCAHAPLAYEPADGELGMRTRSYARTRALLGGAARARRVLAGARGDGMRYVGAYGA